MRKVNHIGSLEPSPTNWLKRMETTDGDHRIWIERLPGESDHQLRERVRVWGVGEARRPVAIAWHACQRFGVQYPPALQALLSPHIRDTPWEKQPRKRSDDRENFLSKVDRYKSTHMRPGTFDRPPRVSSLGIPPPSRAPGSHVDVLSSGAAPPRAVLSSGAGRGGEARPRNAASHSLGSSLSSSDAHRRGISGRTDLRQFSVSRNDRRGGVEVSSRRGGARPPGPTPSFGRPFGASSSVVDV